MTQHQVDKARGILQDLVGHTIPLHPTADGADAVSDGGIGRGLCGAGAAGCGPKLNLVAVTRIERVTRGL